MGISLLCPCLTTFFLAMAPARGQYEAHLRGFADSGVPKNEDACEVLLLWPSHGTASVHAARRCLQWLTLRPNTWARYSSCPQGWILRTQPR